MNQKIRRPKVNLPAEYKARAMLSPTRNGKIDRSYIKMMCEAIHSYNKHRNDSMKKVYKDSSSDD